MESQNQKNKYIVGLDEIMTKKRFQVPFPVAMLEFFKRNGCNNPVKELGHNMELIAEVLLELAVKMTFDPSITINDKICKEKYQTLYILLFRNGDKETMYDEAHIEDFLTSIDMSITELMGSIGEVNNCAMSNGYQIENKLLSMHGATMIIG